MKTLIKYFLHKNNLLKQIIYAFMLQLFFIPKFEIDIIIFLFILLFLISNRIYDDIQNYQYDNETKENTLQLNRKDKINLLILSIVLAIISILISAIYLKSILPIVLFYVITFSIYFISKNRMFINIIPLLKYAFIGILINNFLGTFDLAVLALPIIVYIYDSLDDSRIQQAKTILFILLSIAIVLVIEMPLQAKDIILAIPFLAIIFRKLIPFLLFVPFLINRLI